jgi:hypothetical protein
MFCTHCASHRNTFYRGLSTIPHPSIWRLTIFMAAGARKIVYDIYRGAYVRCIGAIFGILVGFAMLFPNLEMMIMFIPGAHQSKICGNRIYCH